ncbi:hypothetical protein CERSUDRAFT_135818 [Gelatoporia subvermispora B]|uniref:Uncharacterized protein n=1 Tax=Ceriporiopsis subvermispora (strain B) TaxID=914234 RepID=M2QYT4_CERS8|nr:hypothetical protein CERSUDRAFT_135818 [Gelatoporia subvermispora B]
MTAECIPRFALLGRDHEGRLYYALTPEVGERDAARQLLEGKNAKVRLGRRRGGMTPEERREMQRWSWFVSVWGEKPEGALEAKGDDSGEARSDSDDEDEDEAEETWWGFWDPEEIRKLTTWIAMKAGIDEDKGRPLPTRRELRMLVKNLKEQADLLEWRVRRADGDAGADEPEKRPVGGRQVSIKAFYG